MKHPSWVTRRRLKMTLRVAAVAGAVALATLLFGTWITANILVGIGMALGWTFVARYWRVQWYASDEGKHLMGYTLITAVFLTLALLSRIFGTPVVGAPFMAYVAIVLYALLDYLLFRRNWLFTQAQRALRANTPYQPTPVRDNPCP